jgi:hypothetical protein
MTMTERQLIKAKVGLLELAKQPGSVTQACRVNSYWRNNFHRFRNLHTVETSAKRLADGAGR